MKAERFFKGSDGEAPIEVQPEFVFRLILPATESGVRGGLATTQSSLQKTRLTLDELGQVELLLAEILNNVVEHAYAGKSEGEIELNLSVTKAGLFCTIIDDGCQMPGNAPPMGQQVIPGTPTAELPEGGFGWFLIRELAEDLEYERIGDQNRLDFRMPLGLC